MLSALDRCFLIYINALLYCNSFILEFSHLRMRLKTNKVEHSYSLQLLIVHLKYVL